MAQNIGVALGKLAGVSIKQACNDTGKKPKQVGPVTRYAKAGKRAMPQPAYAQHTKVAKNPFLSLMTMNDDLATMTPKARRASKPAEPPTAKKMPASGPIRGTKPMRSEPKLRMRKRPRPDRED